MANAEDDSDATASTAVRSGGTSAAADSEENLLTLAFDLPSPPSDPARAAVDAAADSAGALKAAAEADELPNVPSDLRGSGAAAVSQRQSQQPPAQASARKQHLSLSQKAAQEKTTKLKEFFSSISQDVPRTMSEALLFQTSTGERSPHGDAMLRILFIYVALNSGVGYTQGMNELLAHIYATFSRDSTPDSVEHLEADAFWCFSSLLTELSLQRLLRHGGDDAGGIVWTERLGAVLAERDAVLAAHVRSLSQAHDTDLLRHCTYRWFVVLLAREFDIAGVTRIWDMLLSDANRFSALLLAAYAMLDLMRGALLDADAHQCTELLKAQPAQIGADAVIRRTRTLLDSRGSFKEVLRPAVRTASAKLQELGNTARKKLNNLSAAQAKRMREWRAGMNSSSPPRFTWARPADDSVKGDEAVRPGAPGSAAAAAAAANAAVDHAAAALVAFELPDVPNVPAGTRAPQHQHHLPGEGNLHNVPVVYKARAAVAAVRAGHSSPNSARSGWAERQGRRSTMEDAETVVDDVLALYPELADAVGVRSASFYGVYDGHAGARAAAYLATHLLDVVAGCLIESKARTDEAREAVLARAFRLCDQRLMETSVAEAWEDGSTAVVCLQLDDRMYFANAGDAESVVALRAEGQAALAADCPTLKHKPTDESERERIQGAGGFVIFGRISGMLGVSRAFGDRPFKVPYSKTQGDLVTVEPYTRSYQFGDAHRFLLVACDGLFDVFSYEEVVAFAQRKFDAGVKPNELAESLVDEALRLGSLDNVTCIVVYLHEPAATATKAAAALATEPAAAAATEAATATTSDETASTPTTTTDAVAAADETTPTPMQEDGKESTSSEDAAETATPAPQ
jgi:integrin-linked kinase-associated serine/threonine phosphatase 2C